MSEIEPIALTVLEAARAARTSRTRIYEEFKAGRLRAVKVGSRTLVRPGDLRAWLDAQPGYTR